MTDATGVPFEVLSEPTAVLFGLEAEFKRLERGPDEPVGGEVDHRTDQPGRAMPGVWRAQFGGEGPTAEPG